MAADTRPQELITDGLATPRPRSIQRGDGTAWREWRWRRRDRGYHDQVVDVNVEEEEDSEEGSSDDPEWQGGGRDPVRESGWAKQRLGSGRQKQLWRPLQEDHPQRLWTEPWIRRQQSMQWRWLLKLQVCQETDQLRPAEVRRAPSTGRD